MVELVETPGLSVVELVETPGLSVVELVETPGLSVVELVETLVVLVVELVETPGLSVAELVGTLVVLVVELVEAPGLLVVELVEAPGLSVVELVETLVVLVVELVETHSVDDAQSSTVRPGRCSGHLPPSQTKHVAWVYILECSDGSFYVGSTRDLDRRLTQHQSGTGATYTRRRRPVRLAWAGEYENVADAFAFEKQLQNWSRAKRLAVIEGRWDDLPALARGRSRPDH